MNSSDLFWPSFLYLDQLLLLLFFIYLFIIIIIYLFIFNYVRAWLSEDAGRLRPAGRQLPIPDLADPPGSRLVGCYAT